MTRSAYFRHEPREGERPEATAGRIPEREAGVGQARDSCEERTRGAHDGAEAPPEDRLGSVAGEARRLRAPACGNIQTHARTERSTARQYWMRLYGCVASERVPWAMAISTAASAHSGVTASCSASQRFVKATSFAC